MSKKTKRRLKLTVVSLFSGNRNKDTHAEIGFKVLDILGIREGFI
jgi:hypothetical protein